MSFDKTHSNLQVLIDSFFTAGYCNCINNMICWFAVNYTVYTVYKVYKGEDSMFYQRYLLYNYHHVDFFLQKDTEA